MIKGMLKGSYRDFYLYVIASFEVKDLIKDLMAGFEFSAIFKRLMLCYGVSWQYLATATIGSFGAYSIINYTMLKYD